jgi:two-component system chemotaxis response regulator CheB
MAHPRRVVVVGASAGGPSAVASLLDALPDDLDAPVVVVMHLLGGHPSYLAEVLARRSALAVTQARDGEPLGAGHVYVAPPDKHLVFAGGAIRLDDAAPRHHVRPSVDTTLEAAAEAFGAGTIAVVLTGTGLDGAEGARRVHDCGGTVLAQAEAEFPGMPAAAVETGCVDRLLPLRQIAPAIAELAGVSA